MIKRLFFDTSVLIPAFAEAHPNHKQCFSFLEKISNQKIEVVTSAHALLEFYSVFSKLPLKTRISPLEIKEIIEKNIYPNFKVIALEEKDYKEIILQITSLGLSGGIVYDLFHVVAARKVKSNAIITYNEKDFQKINFAKIPIFLPQDFKN
ncbi:MAG TPA: PIN domain-containing protein [Leptospiraceae bacterium]|nr:PIN domain-containing protein [Leptospiraceae bacterium]HMW07993.1 PIN domain-containing protein [Leptospiraceae bacterium]HMX33619.1 PIN domain-containing protein [Leptospiraceae bacterium]HMY33786.1 PIN domain-containing protein [Leptospiraceae bacterium]HMZ64840.1 PIN domain-containing protein [Leptospiraceae bacterium]